MVCYGFRDLKAIGNGDILHGQKVLRHARRWTSASLTL